MQMASLHPHDDIDADRRLWSDHGPDYANAEPGWLLVAEAA
jgi:hypothetical protein